MRAITVIGSVAAVVLGGFLSPVSGTAQMSLETGGGSYFDVGQDPNDVHGRYKTDLRSSTRALFRHNGVRYLQVVATGHWVVGSMSAGDPINVQLDTRLGPKPDYILVFSYFEVFRSCSVNAVGSNRQRPGRFTDRDSGGWACRVPARPLHISKPVRWRLSGAGSCPSRSCGDITDRAPDHGWYS